MSGLEEQVDDAERTVRRASSSPLVRGVARSGYVASALLRGMIGVLALLLAARIDGPAPGASGAFGAIAAVPGGVVLLALIAAGNGALFLWLVAQGLIVTPHEPLERWRQRLVLWGRSVVYAAIGLIALGFTLGARAADVSEEQGAARQLLEAPGGQLAVALVGGVVLVVGGSMIWLGISRRFVKTIRLPDASGPRRSVLTLGVAAYIAQGATILLVGGTLVYAAFAGDATRIGGLAAALAGYAGGPFGQAALVTIGVGWILAGLYALVRARLARTA